MIINGTKNTATNDSKDSTTNNHTTNTSTCI